MKQIGACVLSLVLVFGSVAVVEADSKSAPQVDLEWSLFEWASRQSEGELGWYEWLLLQYAMQVACGSLGLGAGAAFTPFAGYFTHQICSLGLAA